MCLDHMISWRGHVTSLSERRRGEGWGGVGTPGEAGV